MARNSPAAYGLTISCIDDADEFFSTCDGIEGVAQDVYHRLTNDSVLGEGGEEWGFDITKFAGLPADMLKRRGLFLHEVIGRDDRIEQVDVRIFASKLAGDTYAARVHVSCVTALGPFRRVFAFNDKTVDDITQILEGEA